MDFLRNFPKKIFTVFIYAVNSYKYGNNNNNIYGHDAIGALVTQKICMELLTFSMGYHCHDKLILLMVTLFPFYKLFKDYQNSSFQGNLESSLIEKIIIIP